MGRALNAISVVAVLVGSVRSGAADPEAPRVDGAQIERENLQRLQIEHQRLEREHMALRAARFEEKRQLALEKLSIEEHERQRDRRASRRRSAYFLIGIGVVLGGGAIYLGHLGNQEDEAIVKGRAEFPEEIEQHENRGKIYNVAAYGTLGVAGLMFVIAAPTIAFNLDIGDYSVVPVATESSAGAAVFGTF